MIRVLHIWKTDFLGGGGGAIVMARLNAGLRTAEIDSKILCQRRTTGSSQVMTLPRPPRLELWLRKITTRLGLNDIHCISSFKITENPYFLNTDILHIHGIHSGFFTYLALPRLTERKPTVFTLHDMWPLTGHCAVNYDCERWKIGCGHCPYPDAYPPIRRDGTRAEWKLKKWVYSRSNLTIVSPSKCYAERAKLSMLSHFPIHQIPHGIDTEAYQRLDTEKCRSLLGIPLHKKVLMFSALDLNQFSKGGDILLKALRGIPESLKSELTLLLLGQGGEAIAEAAGIEAFGLGFVTNDRLKAIAYSAADLLISPTRAESFGMVCLESIACGTPVAAFRVGGVPDVVRHGVTGYLAEPENWKDFSNRIVELLEDERLRNLFSQQGQSIAKKEYSLELQVQRHIELYQQVLGV